MRSSETVLVYLGKPGGARRRRALQLAAARDGYFYAGRPSVGRLICAYADRLVEEFGLADDSEVEAG